MGKRWCRIIDRQFQITVCADGFMSIIDRDNNKPQQRLGAALVAHSSDDLDEALYLIGLCSNLTRCNHGGKLGVTIEPRALNWPEFGSVDDTSYIDKLARMLQSAERNNLKVRQLLAKAEGRGE